MNCLHLQARAGERWQALTKDQHKLYLNNYYFRDQKQSEIFQLLIFFVFVNVICQGSYERVSLKLKDVFYCWKLMVAQFLSKTQDCFEWLCLKIRIGFNVGYFSFNYGNLAHVWVSVQDPFRNDAVSKFLSKTNLSLLKVSIINSLSDD